MVPAAEHQEELAEDLFHCLYGQLLVHPPDWVAIVVRAKICSGINSVPVKKFHRSLIEEFKNYLKRLMQK